MCQCVAIPHAMVKNGEKNCIAYNRNYNNSELWKLNITRKYMIILGASSFQHKILSGQSEGSWHIFHWQLPIPKHIAVLYFSLLASWVVSIQRAQCINETKFLDVYCWDRVRALIDGGWHISSQRPQFPPLFSEADIDKQGRGDGGRRGLCGIGREVAF